MNHFGFDAGRAHLFVPIGAQRVPQNRVLAARKRDFDQAVAHQAIRRAKQRGFEVQHLLQDRIGLFDFRARIARARRMAPRMVANREVGVFNHMRELWMGAHHFADHEKRGGRLGALQNRQHFGRPGRVWAIIEGQRYHALSGLNAVNDVRVFAPRGKRFGSWARRGGGFRPRRARQGGDGNGRRHTRFAAAKQKKENKARERAPEGKGKQRNQETSKRENRPSVAQKRRERRIFR